jgi:phenylacetic acid degradation operon negative regulatory protein
MAVVVGDQSPAEDRGDLRGRLRLARYAELREGVWTRPDNLPGPRPEDDGCEWIKATFDDPADTAASLWDLVGWAGRARALEVELTRWETRLDGEGVAVLPAAFVFAADVLRHLQADPLLPRELLANDWPGTSLRSGYDEFDVAFRRVWRDWYRSVR